MASFQKRELKARRVSTLQLKKELYIIILQEINLTRHQCLKHFSILHKVLSTRAESCKRIEGSSLQRRSVVGFSLMGVLLGLQMSKAGTPISTLIL